MSKAFLLMGYNHGKKPFLRGMAWCSADHFGPTCLIVRFRVQLYLRRSLSHVYIEAGNAESKDFRPGTKTSLSPTPGLLY